MHNEDLESDAVYNKQKRLILDEEGILDDEAVYGYCESDKTTNTERDKTSLGVFFAKSKCFFAQNIGNHTKNFEILMHNEDLESDAV